MVFIEIKNIFVLNLNIHANEIHCFFNRFCPFFIWL